ncbi:MAG: class C sortase [Lachnospiraceae bacterium]|nr:class C sortase [Lachnospiraceae bacterium]
MKSNSRRVTIILLFLFLLGLVIVLYPSFSNWWNKRDAVRAIATYNAALEEFVEEDHSEFWEEAERYNAGVASHGKLKEMTEEELAEYNTLLDPVGNGMMGYLSIDAIDVHMPIYHTVDEAVLQVAIGHVPSSSLPTGGKGNHIALSGHRGLPSARILTDLDKLVEGDVFFITVMDRTLAYEVDQIKIVLPEEVDDLAIDPEEDYCTLITCTPYGVNSHRMLVRGVRSDAVLGAGRRFVGSDAVMVDTIFVSIAIAVPMLLLLLIVLFVKTSKKKDHGTEDEE